MEDESSYGTRCIHLPNTSMTQSLEAASALILFLAVSCSTTDPRGLRHLFEGFERGERASGLPFGWVLTETDGRGLPAGWGIVPGFGGGRGLAVQQSTNFGGTCNLAILERFQEKDLSVTVRLRALSGQEELGGGLCWRVQDPGRYYVAHWNVLEGLLVLSVAEDERLTELARAVVDAEVMDWHELGVEVSGRHIRLSFDGRPRIETSDDRISGAGMLGLWTRADACTAFDEMRATW